jgi:hypothetical protein
MRLQNQDHHNASSLELDAYMSPDIDRPGKATPSKVD